MRVLFVSWSSRGEGKMGHDTFLYIASAAEGMPPERSHLWCICWEHDVSWNPADLCCKGYSSCMVARAMHNHPFCCLLGWQ